jgi:hypothetical protein
LFLPPLSLFSMLGIRPRKVTPAVCSMSSWVLTVLSRASSSSAIPIESSRPRPMATITARGTSGATGLTGTTASSSNLTLLVLRFEASEVSRSRPPT